MHKRFVANIISRILIIECFFMMIPLAWALADNCCSLEVEAFATTILAGLLFSCFILKLFKAKPKDYQKINAKDGLAIVGLSWILMSALGALPLFLAQTVPTYTDGFFEIVSGFTTTGATIFRDVEILPRGILFWRSLTHWLGGMGIIVLYLALLPVIGQNAYQLYKAEAPGVTAERIEPRVRETAKSLWGVYFLLSLLETLFLMAGGMTLFDALCHTFGTMATGGFSTRNASLGAFSAYTQWVVIVFMFLAGTNFMLHYQALRGNLKAFKKNEEFRYYFFIAVILSLGFTFVLIQNGSMENPLRHAVFQTVSILTTTGFTTADFDLWPQALRFILVFVMFIGGCGGSTGGGMKVVRFVLSIKIALRSVVQSIFPNAVLPVRFNASMCSDRIIVSVVSYFVIFILLFFFGGILLAITDSCDLVTAFAASIATLSNIGPGLGKIGATQNYAWISIQGKWILTFLMLAGRLELFSILILFVPATWKK